MLGIRGYLSIVIGGAKLRFGLVRPRHDTIEFFSFRKAWNHDIAQSLHVTFKDTGPRPPAGTLIVSNHSGFLDINAIICTCPAETMPNFVSKKEIGDLPIFGWHMGPHGDVLFDRRDPNARRRALDDSLTRLRKGFSLVVFPEGTRQHTGVPTAKIRPALIDAALKEGFLVQPVAIKGTTNLLEQPWRLQRHNPVQISYGEARKDWVNAEQVWAEVLRLYSNLSER